MKTGEEGLSLGRCKESNQDVFGGAWEEEAGREAAPEVRYGAKGCRLYRRGSNFEQRMESQVCLRKIPRRPEMRPGDDEAGAVAGREACGGGCCRNPGPGLQTWWRRVGSICGRKVITTS